MHLEDYRIKEIPGTGFYIPNFVSEERDKLMIEQILKTSKVKWTNLSNRRLQNWGGVPKPKVHKLTYPIYQPVHQTMHFSC